MPIGKRAQTCSGLCAAPQRKFPLGYLDAVANQKADLLSGASEGRKLPLPLCSKTRHKGLPSTAQAYNLPSNNDGKIWNNWE